MSHPEWSSDFYKSGFDGYESPSAFPSQEALEDYRAMLLTRTALQVDFIGRQTGARPLGVYEVGSGNGRLLIALARAGLLQHGLGVEIARSRVAFARRWALDAGLPQVRIGEGDALTFGDFPPGSFDLAACLTGAFNYFEPIRPTAPAEVLDRMREALKPDGWLLLEIHDLPDHRRQALAREGGELRSWSELPPADRFRFYLVECRFWEERGVLRVRKVFIGRDGTVDEGREEVLRYYQVPEVVAILSARGFDRVEVFGDFAGGSYLPGRSSVLVVLARRAAGPVSL